MSLRRNVAVSALGVLARAGHLLLLLHIGRRFGAAALGQFLLALGVFEIVAAVIAAGLTDGTMLLVSRRAAQTAGPPDDEAKRALASVVFTALLVGGAFAVALGIAATAFAAVLPQWGPPGWLWLAWALLPALVTRVAFAATTGLLRLEWEALVGAAGPPLGLLAALPLLQISGVGVAGLFAAFFAVLVLTAAVAAWVLCKRLRAIVPRRDTSPRRAGRRWTSPPLDRALLRFALPQSLNMAATTYTARLDLLMLSAMGQPAAVIGGYGTVSAIIIELRQVRMVASGALGPVVARLCARADHAAIGRVLSASVGWIAALALPAALATTVVYGDVVAAVAPGLGENPTFALILLAGPLVNCVGGLAGNFLVYLLHNRWNLANAVAVAVLQTGLCWLLIPALGLTGAALASALAMAAVTVLENIELRVLAGVHIGQRVLARVVTVLMVGGAVSAAAAPAVRAASFQIRVAMAAGLAVAAVLALRPWPRRVDAGPIWRPAP